MASFQVSPTLSGDFVIFAPDRNRPDRLQAKPVGRDGEGPSAEFDSPIFIDFQAAAAHAFTFIASVGLGAVWLVTPDGEWDRVHWTAAMREPGNARDLRPTTGTKLNAAASTWLDGLHRHFHAIVGSHLKTLGRTGELLVSSNGDAVKVAPSARAIELGVRGFIAVTHPTGEARLVIEEAAAAPGPQPDLRHTPVDCTIAAGVFQLEDFPTASVEEFGNILWAELMASGRPPLTR